MVATILILQGAQAKRGDITNGMPVVQCLLIMVRLRLPKLLQVHCKTISAQLLLVPNHSARVRCKIFLAYANILNAAVKLTVQRYYTPFWRTSIQGTGIKPDIEIPLARLETVEYNKRFEKDLKGALDNTDDEDAKNKSDSDKAEE